MLSLLVNDYYYYTVTITCKILHLTMRKVCLYSKHAWYIHTMCITPPPPGHRYCVYFGRKAPPVGFTMWRRKGNFDAAFFH